MDTALRESVSDAVRHNVGQLEELLGELQEVVRLFGAHRLQPVVADMRAAVPDKADRVRPSPEAGVNLVRGHNLIDLIHQPARRCTLVHAGAL